MVETQRMTEEEFRRLPDDGHMYEFVDGEAIEVPTNFRHDIIISRLNFLMYPLASGRGALTCGQAGFRMKNHNVRAPDLSFTRECRLPTDSDLDDFGNAAPDLCVEVISPSERREDIFRKVGEYFDAGAQTVWLISPPEQTVTVYAPDASARTLLGDDRLRLDDLVPGFDVAVSDLFIR